MPFQPGKSGNPGGRRKKFLKAPDEVLAEAGKSPIVELLALMPTLTPATQAKVWLELLPYVAAKLKDVPAEPDDVSKLSTAELVQLIKEKIPDLEKVA